MSQDLADSPDVIELIEMRRSNLSAAERNVADAILADPAGAAQSSITQLSLRAGASEASVIRFCRTIRLRGYVEMRLRLAAAVERRRDDTDQHGGMALLGEVEATDSTEDVLRKVARADTRAIEVTLQTVDPREVERAAAAMRAAGRVICFGVGSSATAAFDAAAKLNLVGCTAMTVHDVHAALMTVTRAKTGDVVLAFSHSGRAREVVDLLAQAMRNGCTTVLVTSDAGSPATAHADLVLESAAREVTLRSGGIASRIAQLAVVDALFVTIAHECFEDSIQAGNQMHKAVKPYVLGRERGEEA